ncbi:MAG: tripartite tricarboxylate transporter substrate binding protein [Burkholderiales bacterium]|nr:tripartite tricarboxylate transporter substrate binding protein [Burkholderiales bacterium]
MAATPGIVFAQVYPAKPVRLVVPFAPGGTTDIFSRLVTERLAESWPQPMLIDNRPGAASNLGTELVARSPADGYTLLMASPGFAINPSLDPKTGFDPLKDFAPIVFVALTPLVVVVHPSLPVKSLADLVQLAKAHPGKLNFASAGSSTHLAAELLKARAKIDMMHVPYKGTAPATADLLGGHVHLMLDNIQAVLPHVRSGRLRPLAATSLKRPEQLAELPTVAELGYPGFQAASWFGLVAPDDAPAAVIDKLNRDVNAILARADVRSRMSAIGAQPGGGSPADFRRFIEAEVVKWRDLIRQNRLAAN